jgi:ATP-dependent RNA helicase RhlE
MSFASLELIPPLLRAVEEQGYTEPTPIQAQAIPAILARQDIMGCAQTGTGKTAGFTLPMLQRLAPHANTSTSPARHQVLALVLVPTRELAAQVEESVRTYGKYLPLRIAVVYGGVDIKPQIKALQAGVEIVVATPGRLLDHVQGKSISLSQVQILVLDEADRMLDMGFMPDLKKILALLPAFRQNLLFSATFSEDIKRLAKEFMRTPTLIEVARRNAPAELVTHQVYEVAADQKHALLTHLVKTRDMQQVLVFTRMKRDADKLARQLQRDGLLATAIHGDRTQIERTQALDDFKSGKSKILVATDVAARGIDIDSLPFVVNYEIPNVPEDYVHRIGRTGRAGSPGEAISLVSPDEKDYLAAIEKLLKRPITRLETPPLSSGRSSGREGTPSCVQAGTHAGKRTSRDGERPRGTGGSGAPRADHASTEDPAEAYARRMARTAKESARVRPRATYDAPPSAPSANYPHFDFTKPYEPTVKEHAEEALVGEAIDTKHGPHGHNGRKPAPRALGALLGGKAKKA